MDTNVYIIGILFVIVFGIVACFSGYRIFRFLFAILGFIIGAVLGVTLASTLVLVPGQETIIKIVLGLLGGLIGAALAWFLYIVGVFLAGAGIGATVGAAIALAAHADNTLQLILTVVVAIAVGIAAVALQKVFIVLATAFGGAQLIVSGVSQLLNGSSASVVLFNPLALLQSGAGQAMPTAYLIMLASWLVLGILGVLVQYRVTGRSTRKVVVSTPTNASTIQTS
jgi:Domain of unknown function (DUF4203)